MYAQCQIGKFSIAGAQSASAAFAATANAATVLLFDSRPPLSRTAMSCPSPPEIIDLIVDHLHNEPATLKACCVVSTSWIQRARKHLFAHVEFHTSRSDIELWKKSFPDHSNSPAQHTRSLSIHGIPVVTAEDAGVGGWIRTFYNVVHLRLEDPDHENPGASFVPFYGFSPSVRSLTLDSSSLEISDLICSFPLLEDLALICLHPIIDADPDEWIAPSMSPKLTGSLYLKTRWEIQSVTRRLSALPGGLHFARITVVFSIVDTDPIMDLVSSCYDTLESLNINGYLLLGTFSSVSVICQHLIAALGRRHTYDTFP